MECGRPILSGLSMPRRIHAGNSYNFYSWVIIISYLSLQAMRWRLLPQFMDIYYHIHTAWGFIQAGGYSSWDFWQYAPAGRAHIYPPLFHLALVLFIKAGVEKIILAKILEVVFPVLFIAVLWYFMNRNYSKRLAFFVMVTICSSFSFYSFLLNHLPATLALILGMFAFDGILHGKAARPMLLMALCFYAHIGVSWFMILSLFLFGLLDGRRRRLCLFVFVAALLLALPVIFKQCFALRLISISAIPERYFCEFKTIDYLLAFTGLALLSRAAGNYRLFISFFFSSFIFLYYPYRFFSAEGFLPVIMLSAVALDYLWGKLHKQILKYLLILICGIIIIFSPTVAINKDAKMRGRPALKAYFFDSALANMVFPGRNERFGSATLWFPGEYLPLAEIVRLNSRKDDIIYSPLHNIGVCLAAISGRATANALFPEIGPKSKNDPFAVSKIIVFPKDINPADATNIIDKYSLVSIGESKLFAVYLNPLCKAKSITRKPCLPFYEILLISAVFLVLFCRAHSFEGLFKQHFFRFWAGERQ